MCHYVTRAKEAIYEYSDGFEPISSVFNENVFSLTCPPVATV